jgi:hypothetical protein
MTGVNSVVQFRAIAFLADAGVPMIFITLPGMIVLLLPIIAAEMVIIVRRIPVPRTKVLWTTAIANLVSTIVGVPLTWGVLFLCEMGLWTTLAHTTIFGGSSWNSPISRVVGTVLSAPWIAPASDTGSWAVPLAARALLIPFFFVSVWVERRVMEHFIPVTTATDVHTMK